VPSAAFAKCERGESAEDCRTSNTWRNILGGSILFREKFAVGVSQKLEQIRQVLVHETCFQADPA
jgi:hypothetical protein